MIYLCGLGGYASGNSGGNGAGSGMDRDDDDNSNGGGGLDGTVGANAVVAVMVVMVEEVHITLPRETQLSTF